MGCASKGKQGTRTLWVKVACTVSRARCRSLPPDAPQVYAVRHPDLDALGSEGEEDEVLREVQMDDGEGEQGLFEPGTSFVYALTK